MKGWLAGWLAGSEAERRRAGEGGIPQGVRLGRAALGGAATHPRVQAGPPPPPPPPALFSVCPVDVACTCSHPRECFRAGRVWRRGLSVLSPSSLPVCWLLVQESARVFPDFRRRAAEVGEQTRRRGAPPSSLGGGGAAARGHVPPLPLWPSCPTRCKPVPLHSSAPQPDGRIAHFELVLCKSVDTYVRVKQNQNQVVWKWKKVRAEQAGRRGGDMAERRSCPELCTSVSVQASLAAHLLAHARTHACNTLPACAGD